VHRESESRSVNWGGLAEAVMGALSLPGSYKLAGVLNAYITKRQPWPSEGFMQTLLMPQIRNSVKCRGWNRDDTE